MIDNEWDAVRGTAGGRAFGEGLQALARERDVSQERIAEALGLSADEGASLLEGVRRANVAELAALCVVLRARPIEFLQKTHILSLDAYAAGLDPLYFLPEGSVRYDARIYMREINPRHAVPEADMTRRNATLAAVAADELLDARGKVEIELAYLLRVAAQQAGGAV